MFEKKKLAEVIDKYQLVITKNKENAEKIKIGTKTPIEEK